MWPFVDRKGNPQIEPLAPIEDKPNQNGEDNRRKSTPEAEQQEDPMTTLRSSKSLPSLDLAPKRHGLRIPPGAAVSQSSVIFAQGVVSSAKRNPEETHDQAAKEQMAPKIEEAPDSVPGPGPSSVREPPSAQTGETEIAPKNAEPGPGSMKNDQEVQTEANSHGKDEEIRLPPGQEKSQNVDSPPSLEGNEPQEPLSTPAVGNAESSQPETVLDRDSAALVDRLSNTEATKPERRHTWLDTSTNRPQSPVPSQNPRRSSITMPVPAIRVQPTTESEANGQPLVPLAENHAETSPGAIEREIPEIAAYQSQAFSAGPSDVPMQLDAIAINWANEVAPSAEVAPEVPGVKSESLANPVTDKVEGTGEKDHPGLRKLAIRKARNIACTEFVLSILLGRQLAEETKPRLQELAKPSIWRHGKREVRPSPSQVDGIAELE